MRLLLDTHALVWFLSDDPRLSQKTGELIADPENACAVSIATPFEMAIKIGLRKLKVPYGPGIGLRRLLDDNRIDVLHPEPSDYDEYAILPRHHCDPFDRLIAVQTQREGRILVSADPVFDLYGVRRIST